MKLVLVEYLTHGSTDFVRPIPECLDQLESMFTWQEFNNIIISLVR